METGQRNGSNIDGHDNEEEVVIQLCAEMGIQCSDEQAEAALLPHRGKGHPLKAVSWLCTGGFETLEKLESGTYDGPFREKGDANIEASEGSLEARLKDFCRRNSIHESLALPASRQCSKNFNAGCNWILDHHMDADRSYLQEISQVTSVDDAFLARRPQQPLLRSGPGGRKNGSWVCDNCAFVNEIHTATSTCGGCSAPGPFYSQRIYYEEELSKLALNAEREKEELNKKLEWSRIENVYPPDYWDSFPPNINNLMVELVGSKGKLAEEYNNVVNIFKGGGIQPQKVISLKRIQNFSLWQRFCSQRDIIAAKESNNGNANVKYLFHGPRSNTKSILKHGFLGQYGNSSPFGTWTHTSSQYSGGSFADVLPDGSRRIFICQAAVGTSGKDNGSGRCPNIVPPGVLADCHADGSGIHVFYVDSQLYAEYLIHWK